MKGKAPIGEYLPIGSVIELKDSKKIAIIAGYVPDDDLKDLHDYVITFFPEGLKKDGNKFNKDYMFINNNDISRLLFIGYQNDTYFRYIKVLGLTKLRIEANVEAEEQIEDEDIMRMILDSTRDVLKEEKDG